MAFSRGYVNNYILVFVYDGDVNKLWTRGRKFFDGDEHKYQLWKAKFMYHAIKHVEAKDNRRMIRT